MKGEILSIETAERLATLEKDNKRLNNIIDKFEDWLINKQSLYLINTQGFSWGVCGECLDKLKELKEGVTNE